MIGVIGVFGIHVRLVVVSDGPIKKVVVVVVVVYLLKTLLNINQSNEYNKSMGIIT